MRLVSLDMTCPACPSQWEGTTDDGRFLYARYRWGTLSWCVGRSLDAAIRGDGDEEALTVGDSLDGVMSTDEMLRLSGLEY